MKLSDYVVQFIADKGVKHVFMLPGGGAMHLNDSLGRCGQLEYVAVQHEQAAAIAAEAYARVTGQLGVVMVTSGPGGTNTVTGVAAAWLDSTPVLFISGQVKRSDFKRYEGLRQLGVQEIDIVTIVSSVTKYAITILDPDSVRYHLEKACQLAQSGRPGPVWIDIPLDVQGADIEPAQLSGFDPDEIQKPWLKTPLHDLVTQTLQLLNQSERPVILVGNGVRIADGVSQFHELVELLDVPVLTTRLGVDLLASSHSQCFGIPGGIASRAANFTLQNCDFLLILGARLDLALIAYAPERFARAAKKVMVNIDPVEMTKLGAVIDLPVEADARSFIDEMLAQREELKQRDRTPWLEHCIQWKKSYPFVQPEQRTETRGISVYAFSEILSEELEEGDVVLPGSSGFVAEIFLTAFKSKPGQRIFHNKGTGSMGLAQPAALGACLAANRRRTICVDGDGGFAMNIQELETIRRLQLPIKFFVVNNDGYASIRSSQTNYFGKLVAADTTSGLSLPDYIKISEAYGIPAQRITNPTTLREELRSALQKPGPLVCEIMVIPDEPRMPRVASMQRPDGSMVSKPLEDMFPFLDREEFRQNMLIPIIED
ncbi:MAG: thiamine pyrophosphate-binding protein [Proteobacteria bacterium]|nr:thiamine pyrophosphate-binding protein [Pseudomonadota bacterium]